MDNSACVTQVTPEVRVHNNWQPAVYTPTHSGFQGGGEEEEEEEEQKEEEEEGHAAAAPAAG